MASKAMLQVIQYQKTGEMSVEELPVPQVKKGWIVVQNIYSLISAGTERTSVETAKASMVGKARSRPDLVKQVLDTYKKEGFTATYKKVQNRLANYKELGYSSAGIVIDSGVDTMRIGDAVACAGYAYHAEVIQVPKNLAVKMPEGVSFEEAAFSTLGAIAMQGVRQADVRLGESVAVIGLGLLGLITIQLLKATGCRVVGFDISRSNFSLAQKLGCDACFVSNNDSLRRVEAFTKGYGTDAVILTAATRSNEPLELALQYARKKSPIVVVGSVGMNVVREPFYDKELDLRISTSYGPGRYDPSYEENGHDYPVGYVRWTENRNMEAFLDLVAQHKIDVKTLVTHKFPIKEALCAYDIVTGKKKEKYIGILIEYDKQLRAKTASSHYVPLPKPSAPSQHASQLVVGFVGAGNFAQSYLLPPLVKLGVALKGVATSTPVNAKSVGKKFGFEFCASEAGEILNHPDINTVFIASRHDTHARYVVEALKKGKHVFVEKPLAISLEQLDDIKKTYDSLKTPGKPHVAVGFNRRFSEPFRDMKEFFNDTNEPYAIVYRVHAGFMPLKHWMQDPLQGGRFVGEACHFIDCMTYLTGARPIRVFAESAPTKNLPIDTKDTVIATIKFSDGSVGTLLYLANGDSSIAKEYCEVFAGGKTAIMNDFEEVNFFQQGKKKRKSYDRSKGHRQEVEHFVNVILGKEPCRLTFESMYDTTWATIMMIDSLTTGAPR